VALGQVQQAVQQQLLAPGSVCAEPAIQALQLELQHLQEHSKIARVSSTPLWRELLRYVNILHQCYAPFVGLDLNEACDTTVA
jgi:hypothetical protein